MIVYGTTLLALCYLIGLFLGEALGRLIGVGTNVGGVGIAMLLLIAARIYLHRRGVMLTGSPRSTFSWCPRSRSGCSTDC